MGVTQEKKIVLNKLDGITDPCSEALGYDLGLCSMGLVDESSIEIKNDKVIVGVRLTSASCEMIHYFSTEIHDKLDTVGFDEVEIEYDYGLKWSPDMMTHEAKNKMG